MHLVQVHPILGLLSTMHHHSQSAMPHSAREWWWLWANTLPPSRHHHHWSPANSALTSTSRHQHARPRGIVIVSERWCGGGWNDWSWCDVVCTLCDEMWWVCDVIITNMWCNVLKFHAIWCDLGAKGPFSFPFLHVSLCTRVWIQHQDLRLQAVSESAVSIYLSVCLTRWLPLTLPPQFPLLPSVNSLDPPWSTGGKVGREMGEYHSIRAWMKVHDARLYLCALQI